MVGLPVRAWIEDALFLRPPSNSARDAASTARMKKDESVQNSPPQGQRTIAALSLFSSAGVAETYFEKHGIVVKVASELLPQRAKFHEHLYPKAKMFCGDITQPETYKAVLAAAKDAQREFVLATPPCQGMSTAGLQKKDDPRNRLILTVINAVLELKPKFAMIENVPEILQTRIKMGEDWPLIDEVLHNKLGALYNFNERKVVNAMNYGVAQSRERCIYLLARKDCGIKWEFPPPSDHVTTMRDAIGDLPSLDPDITDASEEERLRLFPNYHEKRKAGLAVSRWHYPPQHKLRHVIAMMHTPEGHSAWENEVYYPTLKDGSKSKGYKNTYKRQWWDKPAYTVTMYTSRIGSQENGHPGHPIVDSENEEERIWSDPRTMSIFELMRLSSLPDDWNIPEDASSNVIREIIGEGVPPRLLEAALIELEKASPHVAPVETEKAAPILIHRTERLKALSMFSNVGIAETYFKEVGIDVKVANELLETRSRFYRHLYPDVNMITGDITDPATFESVISAALSEKVDFVMATPPCQGMSCAGRKDPKDPRNFLIYYAIEAVKRIHPKFVLIENVPMQQHTQITYNGESVFIPAYVEAELGDLYEFNKTRVVNTKDYGIPQARSRYIYLLARKDEGIHWEFPPKGNHVVTTEEAIGDLPSLDPLIREVSERWRFPDYERKRQEGLKVSKWHYATMQSWKLVEMMMHTPTGKSAFQNEHFFPKKDGRRVKGAPRTYMRMFWNKPATTIMQNSDVISAFINVHPGRVIVADEDDRKRVYSDARTLSIYELLILSSLPRNWDIPDWADEKTIRQVIGEGIPPLLIKKAVGELERLRNHG